MNMYLKRGIQHETKRRCNSAHPLQESFHPAILNRLPHLHSVTLFFLSN